MAALIRRGELSSVQAVDAHIWAVERVNPHINAMVAHRFDEARAEAQAADDELARQGPSELGVFHGVPCTVKESFALVGMPNTGGLVARRGFAPSEDAVTVQRLRSAGAIILGVTNVSELCMWLESANCVHGRTANPYDAGRIAGGSSGGEGAIVGAGASPLGLGSDIGGSVRLPAFFCGVFGHKPTGGMVPATGQFPIAHGAALRYMTTGPLARRAEDLHPFLRVIAGPDGSDSECRQWTHGDPGSVRLGGLRVVDIADNGATGVTGELRQAQRRCVRWLSARGARIVRPRLPQLKHSLEIWGAMLHEAGGPTFSELLGSGRAIRPATELARWALGRSEHTFPALALAVLERLPTFTGDRARRYMRMGRELQRELETVIGDGVMLFPPYARPAPRHSEPLLRPFEFVYTAIINTMELPATQVPLGLGARGLPLGVQVIGRRGCDHITIAVAQALEDAFGGWVAPTRLHPQI